MQSDSRKNIVLELDMLVIAKIDAEARRRGVDAATLAADLLEREAGDFFCPVGSTNLAAGWITVKEVAEMLGLTRRSVYELCRNGKLPHHRIGGAIRFAPAEVEAATRRGMPLAAAEGGAE